jgi:hypothetical protein
MVSSNSVARSSRASCSAFTAGNIVISNSLHALGPVRTFPLPGDPGAVCFVAQVAQVQAMATRADARKVAAQIWRAMSSNVEEEAEAKAA